MDILMKKLITAFVTACLACALGFTACNCNGEPPKHTHSYTQSSITEPDCYNKGFTTYTCECGATRMGDYTDALGHNIVNNECTRCGYKLHLHEYEKTVIDPTCTEQGYTLGHCLTCGANYTAYFTAPLGHDIVDGHCTRCDYYVHEHDYATSITAPTCTEQGFTTGVCKICGESATFDYTDPLGHKYENGECTRCGDLNDTEGLDYKLSADGSYYICTGKGTATAKYIKIPETYNDKPVAAIGDGAFSYNGGLKKIIIPDSVKYIGNQAFYLCLDLISIDIGSSVTTIGNQAFQRCSNISSITLPNSVNSIGDWAFASCTKLVTIKFPDKVNTIGEYAFYSCHSLFTDITLPDGITTIRKNAFSSSEIKSVTIPNSVTTISESAFEYCDSMTDVTIPVSVTSIGDNAFKDCNKLKDVFYMGTKQQWAAITKGKDWDLDLGGWAHGTYTLHFMDGEIILPTDVLTYSLSADGTYYICNGIDPTISSVRTEIVIPSTYNGKPVKAIGENAFGYDKNLYSIIIPEGITEIGLAALRNCNNLSSITVPDSVTDIGNYAFYGCSKLTSITIPKGIKELESYTFTSCPNLTTIIFKGTADEWKSIPHTDWLYLSSDCTIKCTDGYIGSNGEILSISVLMFNPYGNGYSCSGIKHSINSIVYDVVIPSTYNSKPVVTVSNEAFKENKGLTSVTLQNGITTIGNGAFWGCVNLTSIIIPSSVTTIYGFALNDCSNLSRIVFNGTFEQWCAIEKGAGWYYNTGDYELICNNGTFSKKDSLTVTNK